MLEYSQQFRTDGIPEYALIEYNQQFHTDGVLPLQQVWFPQLRLWQCWAKEVAPSLLS